MLTLVHALIFAVLCFFVATSQAERIQSSIYDNVRMHLAQPAYDLKATDISVSVDGRAITLSAKAESLVQLESVMTSVLHVPGVLSVAIVSPNSNQ